LDQNKILNLPLFEEHKRRALKYAKHCSNLKQEKNASNKRKKNRMNLFIGFSSIMLQYQLEELNI
jgi:hypothetical protein